MAAIISRARIGQGQYIDVALSDCQVATLANIASSVLISGQPDQGRWGTAHRESMAYPFKPILLFANCYSTEASIVPYEAFPTADGNILLGGGNDRLFGIMCTRLGKPEWITDGRFITNDVRVKWRDTLVPLICEETKKKTTQVRRYTSSL